MSFNPSVAYLLVFHGSRDPRPGKAIEHLAGLIERESSEIVSLTPKSSIGLLEKTRPISVGTASLELNALPLYRQIENFAARVGENGIRTLKIIPLFLQAGVHVTEDIPEQLSLVRSPLDLQLQPFLGSYPALKTWLNRQFNSLPGARRLLIAHGSKKKGGNEAIESLATSANAITAYRSIEPGIDLQVENLIATGARSISIIPYFLFQGAITDAIADRIGELSRQYPDVDFHFGEPIGPTPELARIIIGENLS